MAMTAEELENAGFSAEEIAKMVGEDGTYDDENPDFDDDGNEITDLNADDDPNYNDGGDHKDEDAAAPSQVADQQKEGAEVGAEDDGVAAAIDETGESRQTQNFVAPELVEDFDERMKQFAVDKKELREKLNNGDIELDDYEAQKDALLSEENDMRTKQAIATSYFELREKEAKQTWDNEQKEFFDASANKIYESKLLSAALNAAVIDLAKDPKNANRTGAWVLAEADKQVRKEMGIATQAETKQPTPKDRPRKPDLSVVPKTLANLPAAADDENTGGREFAYLDKLDWQQREAAIAKMTADQADRYARLVG